MSVRSVQQTGTLGRHTNPYDAAARRAAPAPWVRNPSWLAMPTVLDSEQKVVSLFAVYPTNSSIAMTISGAFTVDWGDGSTQNFTATSTASKDYDYNASALDDTNAPVTFTASTSTVNRTAHGYTDGMNVQFYNIVTTTGLSEARDYWVINATADTFQVSATAGGSAVTLTNDGSATLLPYKQALIVITPQAANNLTSVNLNVLPTSKAAFATNYGVNHLDLIVSGSNITALYIASNNGGGQNVSARMLERAQFISSNQVSNWNFCFYNCARLQSVPVWNIRTDVSVTITNMFQGCASLAVAPDLETSRATSVASMFSGCANLVSVPRYDLSNNATFVNMFQNCYVLRSVPLFKYTPSLITSASGMFQNCYEITDIPAWDLSNATNLAGMFSGCSSLRVAPFVKTNTSANWSASGMFQSCSSLSYLPPIDLTRANDTTQFLYTCNSLTQLPWTTLNLPNISTASYMFGQMPALLSVPDITFGPSCSTFNFMFTNNSSLKSVGTITMQSTGGIISAASMFNSCASLTSVNINNASAIVGCAAMFNGCTSLQSVTMGATNINSETSAMFGGCYNLYSHTPITVAAGTAQTNFVNPYTSCFNLRKGGITGAVNTLSIGPIMASTDDFTNYYLNTIGKAASPPTSTVILTNNPGVGYVSFTASQSGTTVTTGSTSNLVAGMYLGNLYTGPGVYSPNISATVSTSTFTVTAHGMANGDKIGFSGNSTVTGITTFTLYYVVNATADTFQVSATPGGGAITLGGVDSSAVGVIYPRYIKSVDSGTTLTVSGPAATISLTSWAARRADTRNAIIRGWSVTG